MEERGHLHEKWPRVRGGATKQSELGRRQAVRPAETQAQSPKSATALEHVRHPMLFDGHHDLVGAHHIQLRARGGLNGARICPQTLDIALERVVRLAQCLDLGRYLLMSLAGHAHLGVRPHRHRHAQREGGEHDCHEDRPRGN